MKIVVVFDGTLNAKKAVSYAIKKSAQQNATLTIVAIFNNTLFYDYGAGPAALDAARTEFLSQVEWVKGLVQGPGVAGNSIVTYEGDPEEIVLSVSEQERPDRVILPPRLSYISSKINVPVQVVPGTVLVPVDSAGPMPGLIDNAATEALETCSRVVIVGIIPIHIYSSTEKRELEEIRKKTEAIISGMKKKLEAKGITVQEAMRSGFPDEEILKAASEFNASLIILPSSSATPSELTKAASIILEEKERFLRPVILFP